MRRAIVLVDPSDAGIGALEAARRVASAASPEITVVSVGADPGQHGALATASARHLERSAVLDAAAPGLGLEPRLGTIESISLGGDPARVTTALLAAARADLVIVGLSTTREHCPVVRACLGSDAAAILVAKPGARREDHAYRHVAAAGFSPRETLPVAHAMAADDALLSATFLVQPDAPLGSIAEAHAEALELQRDYDLDAAIVEGQADDLGDWLVEHGVEIVAVPSPPAGGVDELDAVSRHLIAPGRPDLLLVRPIHPEPAGMRGLAGLARDDRSTDEHLIAR